MAKARQLVSQKSLEFREKMKPFKMKQSELMEQMESFENSMNTTVDARTQQNNSEVELANFKLVASPAVGGAAYMCYCHWVIAGAGVAGVVYARMKKRQRTETQARGTEVFVCDSKVTA